MNIVTEANISGKPIADKTHKRPVRMLRWFVIVGSLLVLVVGGIVYFEYLRAGFIKNIFPNNKPPPVAVTIREAKSEVIRNLPTPVGDLAAGHQSNVPSDVSARITQILFHP